jgi:FkbM family methyltransferase
MSIASLRTGIRVMTCLNMWRVVGRELGRKCGFARRQPLPEVRVLEQDPGAGLALIEIRRRSYWQPAGMNWAVLPSIHAEIFDPAHPHYYEFEQCRIEAGDVVVDAGASEGFFTRFALERGARVVVVEPWARQVEALRRTFAPEIAADRVRVVQVALAPQEGEAWFDVDPLCPWSASLADERHSARCERVPTCTLGQIIDRTWGACHFLKMDIEGQELQVIPSARDTLSQHRPKVSIAVYHQISGYYRVRQALQQSSAAYHVSGKGLQRRGLMLFPMILHAWPMAR